MLKTILQQQIHEQGPLRLDQFIDQALYHPAYGYYRTTIPVGKSGDFITAPEICSLFGELIGLFLLDYWHQTGCPAPIRLVELGPGKGTMMADILKSFHLRPAIFDHLTVHLVEVSESLKTLQQEQLKSYPFATWQSSLAEVPDGFQLIIGNEFFDALSIRQFIFDGTWGERFVTYDGSKFCFTELTCEQAPVDFTPEAPCFVETSEASLAYADLIADKISKQGGLGLFIDYGAEKEPWTGDSLQTMKKNRYMDVLSHIGTADITHHVDFLSLKNQFKNKGLTTFGSLTQGNFLTNLGIELRLQQQSKLLSSDELKKLQLAIFRLISPKYMGQLFKVLAVSNNQKIQPAGF